MSVLKHFSEVSASFTRVGLGGAHVITDGLKSKKEENHFKNQQNGTCGGGGPGKIFFFGLRNLLKSLTVSAHTHLGRGTDRR